MTKNTLATLVRSGLRTAGLVSVSAALSAAIVLRAVEQEDSDQGDPEVEIQDVIRTKRIEVVDDEGGVCLVLNGGQSGGWMQLQRPGRTVNGKSEPTFAYIGSVFPGHADFFFGDPTGDSTVGLSMSIGGMPQSGVLTLTGLGGGEVLRLDTWPLRPTLTLRKPGDGPVLIQK